MVLWGIKNRNSVVLFNKREKLENNKIKKKGHFYANLDFEKIEFIFLV